MNMLSKIDLQLVFDNKRNLNLITPCCDKTNRDGKFVNYKNLPQNFGYCHSCGKASLPPTLYKDEKGVEYVWNDVENRFVTSVLHTYCKNVKVYDNDLKQCNTNDSTRVRQIKYISMSLIHKFSLCGVENNLLKYICNTYGVEKCKSVEKVYYIGTCKDGGTIFWNINEEGKVQKAKVSYYKPDGKRTQYFKVPYKNEDGYYSCLFGLHLINLDENKDKPIILVESEKTAIICTLHLPEYIWLAYGGINGLTKDKIKPLVGRKVILVPDISENAVEIMKNKIHHLTKMGIDAKIWDMTNGKTDEQLKKEGWYNCDLEDVFRVFVKK